MGNGDDEFPSLADTIATVRRELSSAQAAGQGQAVQFWTGPVELEFDVAVTRTRGGEAGMQICVLTLGGKLEREHATTQRIKVTLQPVNPKTARTRRSPTLARGGNRPGRRRSLGGRWRYLGTACGWRGRGGGMGIDRYRVCELYAEGPDAAGSGSGYRVGDRLVLTARHVIAPAGGAGGRVLVRPLGLSGWLSARVEWGDTDADAALVVIEDEDWRAPAGESVLRWGELAGSDPVPCAAVGFPWASARPDQMRDTAHVYGQLAPLGQLRQGRLDFDVASASPSHRLGGSPWSGMSGAGVIADNHLVAVVTVDPARYQDRLVAMPISRLLGDEGFRARLAEHGVRAEAAPVGAGWYLELPGEQSVSLAPAYRPVSRRFRPAPSTLLRPEHGLVPFLGRQAVLDQISGWCQGPPGTPVLLVVGGGGSGKTRLGREACAQMLVAGWDTGIADDQRRDGAATTRLQRPTLLMVDDADLRTGLISALVDYLRWDDAGPPVGLLLLARAAGAWWDRLVRQQGLDDAYTIVDLDRHPVPLDRPGRALPPREHRVRCLRQARGTTGCLAARAELDDPAYAEPLLIHIAALMRTRRHVRDPGVGPGRGPRPGRRRHRRSGAVCPARAAAGVV